MPTRARLATVLTTIAVAVIAAIASLMAGTGPAAAIGGNGSKADSYPSTPVQNLAFLQQSPRQTNTVYVPITPCRLVDTRVAGGPLADNTTRNYYVSGSTGFPNQGGRSGGCGIPAAATAVSASLTANTPSAAGYLRAWPSNIPTEPIASVLSYNESLGVTSGATLSIAPNTAQPLTVRNHHGPVGLVIDVTGYYEPQMHGIVSSAGTIFAGSSRIVSANHSATGVFTVTFDGDITYCTPMVDTYNAGVGVYGAAYAFNGDTATVFTWYLDSTTHAETLHDFYFYIFVAC